MWGIKQPDVLAWTLLAEYEDISGTILACVDSRIAGTILACAVIILMSMIFCVIILMSMIGQMVKSCDG